MSDKKLLGFLSLEMVPWYICRALEDIKDKAEEVHEYTTERADWPEDGAGWPSGPWADPLCDGVMMLVTADGALRVINELHESGYQLAIVPIPPTEEEMRDIGLPLPPTA